MYFHSLILHPIHPDQANFFHAQININDIHAEVLRIKISRSVVIGEGKLPAGCLLGEGFLPDGRLWHRAELPPASCVSTGTRASHASRRGSAAPPPPLAASQITNRILK